MMCSTFSSCRLYSWMRFTWLSKIVSGSTVMPVVLLTQTAKRALAARLARRKPSRNDGSPRQGDDPLELGQIGHPAVADRTR